MTTMGSLFTGYCGLDMAVEQVLGASLAWCSDIEPGPCKVISHRFPGVPNIGDVSTVDWSSVEPVDVLTGGFPCTDVSLAGARAGLREGTRSGLWNYMAEAIAVLQPSLVVIENVRGLLSADADSHLESCPWCVGDPPAEPPLRALGAVLGDLADLGYDCQWVSVRASDVGAPHRRERVFLAATHANGFGCAWGGSARGRGPGLTDDSHVVLLPTPVAQPSGNTPEEHLRKKPGRKVITDLAILAANEFLPTPTTARRSTNSDHGRVTPTLVGLAQGLLPTPRATDAGNSMTAPSALAHVEAGFGTLPEVLGVHLLPISAASANDEESHVQPAPNTGSDQILPGLRYEDEQKAFQRKTGGPDEVPFQKDLFPIVRQHQGCSDRGCSTLEGEEASRLRVRDMWDDRRSPRAPHRPEPGQQHARESGNSMCLMPLEASLVRGSKQACGCHSWFPFSAAVHRWESIVGRSAPPPTEVSSRGNPRLSARAVEWMMGLPSGWVCDVPGVSRAEALRLLGNGVVPQQAVAALEWLVSSCPDRLRKVSGNVYY